MSDRFIVPPFSVLDSRQGYWQDRKSKWKAIINSHSGRGDVLLGEGLNALTKKLGAKDIDGTSVFDPVLTEILIKWFCPVDGNVIDCFAGGSVRGLMSTYFGRHYAGVDLSEKQIVANKEGYEYIRDIPNGQGGKWEEPRWICGDSLHIDSLISGEDFDFLLTCPPYGDLEVYSDKPEDISNMPYEQFKQVYTEIIKKTCAKLKDNAFAAIVVGDIRDKKGNYRGFIEDTKTAFREAGLSLYNECVLIEVVATAAVRAGRQFIGGRKVVKTHQNVLVFIKGDVKAILPRLQDCSEEIKEVLGAVEEECQEA